MANDLADGQAGIRGRVDQPIADSLMRPLGKIMRTEFFDGVPQHVLPEEHEPVEAFSVDAAHESFSEGVQIGTSGRQPQVK